MKFTPSIFTATLAACLLLVLPAVGSAGNRAMVGSAAVQSKLKPGMHTIKRPLAGQTISGVYYVRPRTSGKRTRRYSVTIKVDGRTVTRRRSTSRGKALRRLRLDTRKLANGYHRLSIEIRKRTKPKRARQTIRFRVSNIPQPGQPPASVTPYNFTLLFTEDFSKDAPVGSWDPDSVPWPTPVYTGASGVQWTAYWSGARDTWNQNPYRAKQVLSVHNGVLDFNLHNVDGLNAGASISPISPSGIQYQTYGRYSIRLRVTKNLPEYHIASLLWPLPENETEWVSAESDFPEVFLDTGLKGIDGYAHLGPGTADQEAIHTDVMGRLYDLADWHTFTQEWTPKVNRYYVDDTFVGQTTRYGYHKPMRWQIQAQTRGGVPASSNSGSLQVDWVAAWAWTPRG